MEQAELLLNEQYTKWAQKCMRNENGICYFNIGLLENHPARELILYELLKDFGFNGKQIQQISNTADGQSGKQFLSSTSRLVRERNVLTINNLEEPTIVAIQLQEGTSDASTKHGTLQLATQDPPQSFKTHNENIAYVDTKKLQFPLTWRSCKKGDYFYPLGLQKPNSKKTGKKKISKYFKDTKYSQLEKEASTVLVDAKGRVVWLVAQRLDDRFKINDHTKEALRITYSE
jgi:tRNA(Ile)-lysidine synthase